MRPRSNALRGSPRPPGAGLGGCPIVAAPVADIEDAPSPSPGGRRLPRTTPVHRPKQPRQPRRRRRHHDPTRAQEQHERIQRPRQSPERRHPRIRTAAPKPRVKSRDPPARDESPPTNPPSRANPPTKAPPTSRDINRDTAPQSAPAQRKARRRTGRNSPPPVHPTASACENHEHTPPRTTTHCRHAGKIPATRIPSPPAKAPMPQAREPAANKQREASRSFAAPRAKEKQRDGNVAAAVRPWRAHEKATLSRARLRPQVPAPVSPVTNAGVC